MNCNPSWWVATKTAPERDPLDAINTLADCLRQGAPVPEPAASLLLAGLLRFMAGSRFEQAMGLQAPRSGQRTPVQIAAMDRRKAAHIDQLAGQIDQAAPDLPEAARATVLAIIASARAVWIRSTSEPVDRSLSEHQDYQNADLADDGGDDEV